MEALRLAVPTTGRAGLVVSNAGCSAVARLAQRRGAAVVAIFGTGSAGAEQLLLAAHQGLLDTVIVERLAALHDHPEAALAVVARLLRLGVLVISSTEPWVERIGTGLADLADWLSETTAARRSMALRRAVARAAAEGRRPGRPPRQIDDALAHDLLGKMPLARAAAELGVGASTLRRWARQHAGGTRRLVHPSVA
jgi:DNA invertase Pin-like site-specific DNA recombinase